MIECIFTLDYEIYGNGEGSLKELVYEPAEKMKNIFEKWNVRFSAFIEVAELEMIESKGTDEAIDLVKHQLRDLFREGFELGLHIHPWWYNARNKDGKWILDFSEYNLCALPIERVNQIVNRSIIYFRKALDVADFTPICFRAGHLLFQPTRALSTAIAERGIKVDSSVYKGGLWHQQKLDYRPALKHGYYWKFSDDVNLSDPQGALLELPIYTQMVPIWKIFSSKRIGLQQKGSSVVKPGKKISRHLADFLRFRYPLKFDLGQMTMKEIMRMINNIVREDHKSPESFRPIVLIMHTKDRIDYEAVDFLLSYLERYDIKVSCFRDIYHKV